MSHDKTRKGWLRAAVQKLEARLEKAGQKMPESWAVSVGFPKRAHAKVAAIEEYGMPKDFMGDEMIIAEG